MIYTGKNGGLRFLKIIFPDSAKVLSVFAVISVLAMFYFILFFKLGHKLQTELHAVFNKPLK